MLSRYHRRLLSQKHRVFSSYIRYDDVQDENGAAPPHNPCHINDGALLDLKTRSDATTHARRCEHCNCPLYEMNSCVPCVEINGCSLGCR